MNTDNAAASGATYPTYRFAYPRPAYSLDVRPVYPITDGDPDEAIVTNYSL